MFNLFKEKNIIIWLKIFAISLIIVSYSEIIFRTRGTFFLKWVFSSPLLFVLNIIYGMLIIGLFSFIFRRIKIGIVLGVFVISLFNIINNIKFSLRGEIFIYSDIFLASEAMNIISKIFTVSLLKYIIFGILCVVTIVLMSKWIFEKNAKMKINFINIGVFFLIIMIFVSYRFLNIKVFLNDVKINGYLLTFVNSIGEKTHNVDESKLKDITEDLYSSLKEDNNINDDDIKPNIIFVMNEAFWDIKRLPNIEFNIDPIKNFRDLEKVSISGNLYVPTMGGGTSNTEFEILTGMSLLYYVNDWHMVYTNEIKSPIISIPSILKNQGYKSVAIHSYESWYYDRKNIYKYMGFDEFISLEYFNNGKAKGFYTSDEYTTNILINKIEEVEDPLMVYCITMQNHGPYNDDRYMYDKMDIELISEYSEDSTQILETYTQGIYDADQSLKQLVDYLKDSNEPTIVIFFGDHLPMLGENYLAYKESGYISNDNILSDDEVLRLHTVPYIIWSNYKNLYKKVDTMNASFLMQEVFNVSNIIKPEYLKILEGIKSEMPVITRNFGIDKNNNIIYKDNETYIEMLNKYNAVQNDIMYGDKVLLKDPSKWIVQDNSDYNSGRSDITIKNHEIKTIEDVKYLHIYGTNFFSKNQLLLNDKEVAYEWISQNEIVIANYNLLINNKIILKLKDSKGTQLIESNSYIIGVK